MSLFTQAFDAGVQLAARTLAPHIHYLEQKVETLEDALSQISRSPNIFSQHDAFSPTGRLILITLLTDDSEGRIVVKETDTLGAAVAAGTVTASVDAPAKAAVAVDPENPMEYVVTRLPLAPGDPDTLDVAATLTDSISGFSETAILRFGPGKAAAMTLDVTVEPIPAAASASGGAAPPPGGAAPPALPAVGDIIRLPSNPTDSTSPPADHNVTAVAADGSAVTAQPVAGGISVTVPPTSILPPAQ